MTRTTTIYTTHASGPVEDIEVSEDCAQFLQSRPVKKVCHGQHEKNAEKRPCTEQTKFRTQYTCAQSARRLPQLCKQSQYGVSQRVRLTLMKYDETCLCWSAFQQSSSDLLHLWLKSVCFKALTLMRQTLRPSLAKLKS